MKFINFLKNIKYLYIIANEELAYNLEKKDEENNKIKSKYGEELLKVQRKTAQEYLNLEDRVRDTINKKVIYFYFFNNNL